MLICIVDLKNASVACLPWQQCMRDEKGRVIEMYLSFTDLHYVPARGLHTSSAWPQFNPESSKYHPHLTGEESELVELQKLAQVTLLENNINGIGVQVA